SRESGELFRSSALGGPPSSRESSGTPMPGATSSPSLSGLVGVPAPSAASAGKPAGTPMPSATSSREPSDASRAPLLPDPGGTPMPSATSSGLVSPAIPGEPTPAPQQSVSIGVPSPVRSRTPAFLGAGVV